jgi:serine/threonine protein kinase
MSSYDSFPEVDSTLLAGLARTASIATGDAGDASERSARERLRALAAEAGRKRYVLKGEIGRGGMGVVFRVEDADLRRTLAMKVALRGRSGAARGAEENDPVLLARFLEEARVTARLDHPGIVPLHEVGMDQRGRAYFTMRLVRGRHLGEVFDLARRGQEGWSRERVVEALVKACEAMAYAHSKGIVHRDLKPQNVMTGRFGEVYVMDWGVAKILEQRSAAPADSLAPDVTRAYASDTDSGGVVTVAGTVFGTPVYMAPEQARGEIDRLDARSDVYSMGAILYELVAGHPPYTPPGARVSIHTVLKWVVEGPPAPLANVAHDAPRDLIAVCEKAMARDPARRYADMRALADDLRAWLAGRPVSALPLTPLARGARWCRRYPWVAALLIAVTLGGVVGLWVLSALGAKVVANAAIEEAAAKARMLETVNGLYSSSVVARVDRAHVDVTHDWEQQAGAIPLPATFLTELAARISADSSGVVVKHYSDQPFRFRGAPQLDEFGTKALAALRARPDEPVLAFERIDGRTVLRYAVARRMGESCVGCHNAHPESPRHDWKVGDVRGVLEIDQSLDAIEQSRAGLGTTLLVVAGLVVGLTGLCAFALVRSARGEHSR